MTAQAAELDHCPEIPGPLVESVAMWSRVLDAAQPSVVRDVLRNAAQDLYRSNRVGRFDCLAEIADFLQRHAEINEIPDDEAQQIFAEGRTRAEAANVKSAPTINGRAREVVTTVPEPPPPESPDDYGAVNVPAVQQTREIIPAAFAMPSQWEQEAPPPVDWLAAGRIPRGDVTTLHGDGGAGKTDIALRLAANVARGVPDWLGHEIANGPVALVSAEEPEREVKRRLWLHATRDGYKFADLKDLHPWFPDKGGDTVLAVPDYHSGIMRPTRLMQEITLAIAQAEPVLVIVDNVAATFAGNQNDRVMVRSYVNLWRTIARGPGTPAVLLLDHPSLSGLTNGSGRGGNMDWRNAVRSALYLRPSADQAETDLGIRILETAKSNYGLSGPSTGLRLRWQEGGLQLEHAPSSLHRLAKDQECDETFLRLLDERTAQGRYVVDKYSASYAPKVFAGMDAAGGFTKQAFAQAMDRLFKSGKISMKSYGPPSRGSTRIERARPDAIAAE